ncbi:lipase member N [Hyalella azteca]|uniref:Lipase member N n=1 Tax=Hyalella azteca TaxID=294128 RepID=A0A8B7NBR1_HYAAZ|nr:lipase member N [Hyalella azteca]
MICRIISVKIFLLLNFFTSSFGLFNVSLSTIFNENKPLVGFALTTFEKILNPKAAPTSLNTAGFTSKLTKLLARVKHIPPQVYFTTHQHILQHGYPAEEHFVVTPDGYILTVNRIAGPRHSRGRSRSPDVVLLMTSVISSSSDFILDAPDSLGYVLADAGYDVWLGSNRGTREGRNHTRLNPDKDKRFWNFSLDEIARYDYPALASYITRHAGVERFFFVGFSAANRCLFMSASLPNSFMNKIRMVVSLAPMIGTENPSLFMKFFSKFIDDDIVQGVLEQFNGGQFYHGNDFMKSLLYIACSDRSKLRPICLYFTKFTGGVHKGYLGKDRLAFGLNSALSGASNKAIEHITQINLTPDLRMYSYGAGNMAVYGTETSPVYNLSLVSAPIALVVSPKDQVTHIRDLAYLRKSLPNVVATHVVQQRDYGHLDLIYADNARKSVYDNVLQLMRQY